MGKILLKNVGALLTGDLLSPIAQANSIIIKDDKINEVDMDLCISESNSIIIDVKGLTVAPGLIDCHCHPVIGDWTPRQRALNWIEAYLRAGVTGLISAGEVHVPGRPRDGEGCKALAILAYKTSQNYRPAGMKVYGGALILEPDATERDFEECAHIGIWHTGEIGIGQANDPETASPMVKWARKYGIKTLAHTGGTSLPGSALMGAEALIGIDPDVLCHLNGGCIPVPLEDMQRLLKETKAQIEISRIGNPRSTIELLQLLKERNELNRLMLGTDTPSGMGLYPLGIWEVICFLSSLGDIRSEITISLATGNTAKFYNLPVGFIKPGYQADLIVIDAPVGAYTEDALSSITEGIIPGISLVIVDGKILFEGEGNKPPPKRVAIRDRR